MKCVVDTNILMSGIDLSGYDRIYIPIPVLEELDKHNHSDSPEKSYKARVAMRMLEDLEGKTEYSLCNVSMGIQIPSWSTPGCKDDIILVYAEMLEREEGTFLLTMDLNMYYKARALGITCQLYRQAKTAIYKGYKEVTMTDEEYSSFVNNLDTTDNKFDLLENQYLIIRDEESNFVDKYRWTSDGYKFLNTRSFKSQYWETIKPLPDDPTQACAFDSLYNNDITVLFGRSGCGKTMLSLSYLMSRLQTGKLNKLYIVHTFTPLKNAKTLGFLPGNKEEKIFASGLGTILSTKFGDIEQTVKPLIQSNKLEIIPTYDIRGVEFGADDAMYITEAQNTDPYTIKTAIQRCKQGCKIIIEGDMLEQTDIYTPKNGMERVIEVFAGSKYFGCVKLQKNNRSPICELADQI